LIKKFGNKALLALSQLEKENILHHFPQLIETSKNKVAQAEHTILINNGEVIVTTD
jgi:methionine aminopeptidase